MCRMGTQALHELLFAMIFDGESMHFGADGVLIIDMVDISSSVNKILTELVVLYEVLVLSVTIANSIPLQ